ncbi:uncharacterized protein G2W53_001624 [Senna tora]|uniref:Uncharacterized protein n=1 Tax=Senna tora TaxID=362788 RepID=A0A834XG91_9FABA|nr:uncharacterized protein G2W53_001624 [Senna tora]
MNSCIPSTDRLKFWPSCRTASNLESKASSLASKAASLRSMEVLLLDGGCGTCRCCCHWTTAKLRTISGSCGCKGDRGTEIGDELDEGEGRFAMVAGVEVGGVRWRWRRLAKVRKKAHGGDE